MEVVQCGSAPIDRYLGAKQEAKLMWVGVKAEWRRFSIDYYQPWARQHSSVVDAD